jgi:hypothetical protein
LVGYGYLVLGALFDAVGGGAVGIALMRNVRCMGIWIVQLVLPLMMK